MTNLSSGHKVLPGEDSTVDGLLDLDGEIFEVGGGYWVKIKARRVAATSSKPHGIDYSLCLFGPNNERLVCFDNAHAVPVGSGPAKKQTSENDHVHKKGVTRPRPYVFTDAGTLLVDFWAAVYTILKREGVP